MKIFVCAHLDEPSRALLRTELSGLDVCWGDRQTAPLGGWDDFAASDVCFGNVPAAWLEKSTQLCWMQLESVGFEYYQKLDAVVAQKKILLTNLSGMFAWPAAESALAGLLALLRGVDQCTVKQREHCWSSLDIRPTMGLLHRRKALVVGLGSIGKLVRDLLRAFECEVTGYARTTLGADLRRPEELDGRLGEFGVVVNCLPNTPETVGFFHRKRFARFSPQAIFVNIGRGSTVDEDALVEALQQRKIDGAVLDVFKEEPLPPNHPLWDCPRTILLHHTGGGYAEELIDKTKMFLANLARYRAGEPLQNQIDLNRGY